jgi:hypothetical protein
MNPTIPAYNLGAVNTAATNNNADNNSQQSLINIPRTLQNPQVQSGTDTDMEGVENTTNTMNNEASNQNNQLNRYSIEHPQGKFKLLNLWDI